MFDVSSGGGSSDRCAVPPVADDLGRRGGLPTTACPAGYACRADPALAQRGLGVGNCRREEAAQVGEDCSASIPCVEADGEGRLVVCPQGETRKCSSRLEDGESCVMENAVCGSDDVNDGLRAGSCDGENVCRVTEDRTCKADGDCDSAAGLSCVSVLDMPDAGSKTCYNYNRQLGESCKSGNEFGSEWSVACAEGLLCKETSPGRASVDGRCVQVVKDGERCSPGENIECLGSFFDDRKTSICNNGTCRPL